MSDAADLRRRILDLPPKRLALLALELQEQLDRERAARAEPIAVVGMACRFPGGSNSPEQYWELLDEGRDAISEVPAERFDVDAMYDPDPDAAGKVATRWGGFVDDVQRFDAGFFSISPREARAMDPQQRLLLETCWRAFEDAGIPAARHYGTKAGVFVGICSNDYLVRLLKEGTEAMDLYLSSGNAYSVAAGRLSFTLGFQGPAFAVDTACSSSLVALHAACQSLRQGESTFAVAAGVNVMSSVETFMALSRSHMMAPDGRCKTFDDAADGFVRAEGCGVLLLKRLSDAVRDGDTIRAVIRGSAVNQDGRSTGLTVPNGPAQEQVVRAALENAALTPDEIDYIEAHGTGTSLGDPIEIRALGRVFGANRSEPLYVGSVKTNFGHLESAAGVAGVIKAILSIEHGRIPPHLHFETPSRHIEWDEFAVRVPADGAAWPDTGRPRRAGVSSFGFSGTNAHVIIEQAPARAHNGILAEPVRSAELIPVSAYTTAARDGLTGDFAAALAALPDREFADFAHSARVARTHFGYRRAVVAANAEHAVAALSGAADTILYESPSRCGDEPGVVFMFTGQGAQHPGMGRALYENAPAFRYAIDRCAEILDPLLDVPLRGVLFDDGGDDAPIYRTTLAQPAVVAFEYALAELWRSWGVRPAAVIGHSLGEFVAATIAGVMTLEEMLPLVRERGRLLDSLPTGQRMAAVFASADALASLLAANPGTYIAAFNAPENTVISGDATAVDALLAQCAARGIDHRVLRLEKAFHTPGVDPVMDALETAGSRVQYAAPRIPIAWNVTGSVGGTGASSGSYWRHHARGSVHFTQGVQALAEQGFRHFLEVGPHPTLSPLITQAVDGAIAVPSLRRGGDAWRDTMEAVAQLYVSGVNPDWPALDAGTSRTRVAVPVHPFGGERYWVDGSDELRTSAPRGAVPGTRLSAAVPIFETVFAPSSPAFLDQHRFRGTAVVPGPVFAELALAAAASEGHAATAVADLEIVAGAFVPDDGLRIQTVLNVGENGVAFRILSAPAGSDAWTLNASGRLAAGEDEAASIDVGEQQWKTVDVAAHLELLHDLEFQLGPDAALYDSIETGSGVARAQLRAAAPGTPPAIARALVLDAAFQVLGAALAAQQPAQPRMLSGVGSIRIHRDALNAVRCTARITSPPSGSVVHGEITLEDAAGDIVLSATGVALSRVARGDIADSWFHTLEWRPVADESFAANAVEAAGASLASAWGGIATESALAEYVVWLEPLRERVAWHVWRALTGLGLPASGAWPSAEAVCDELRIADRHRRLVGRLLDVLVESGTLVCSGSGYIVNAVPVEPLAAAPADCGAVLTLVERCGSELASVLTGATDPLTLLFPAGAADVTREIYRGTPFGRAFNDAVTAAVASLPANVPLRILEIGAGSGSTTEAVLAGIGERAVDYVFTDVSPTLVAAAQSALAGRAGVTFGILDIENDVADQGYAERSFDIVVAANVLHATSDIAAAVSRAERLLRSGGLLLLLEGTHRESWVDITFGLTDGWWRFTDTALRPDYPLLTRAEWTRVLRASGFAEVRTLPDDLVAHRTGQALILAHRQQPEVSVADDVILFDARRDTDPLRLLETLRSVAAASEPPRVWVVTENAQPVHQDDCPNPDGAVLWGLGRTFALEHPDRWGGLLDLEIGTAEDAAALQIAYAVNDPAEDQVAYRGGVRLRARLLSSAAPHGLPLTLDGGSYLITGGLGGLGLNIARWLAERGADRVVLVGRSTAADAWAADDPRRSVLAELRATGVTVDIRSVDITSSVAVTDLIGSIESLRGIIHAAAVFDSAAITELTHERLDRVLAPKVDGARHLAERARDLPLDFMLFFSSTTSLLGVAGLGAYAAANQYLDSLAVRLRAEGVPALSIQWGLWEEMRLADAADAERYAQTGLLRMDTSAALDAMGRVLADHRSDAGVAVAGTSRSAVVARVDWTRLRSVYEARRARPMLAELGAGSSVADAADNAPGAAIALIDQLAALPAADRSTRIMGAITEELRAVLRMSNGSIDTECGFFEMGMDSLMSVELKTRLEKRFGAKLPATLTFNYPTVAAVAGFIEDRAASLVVEPAAVAAVPAPAPVLSVSTPDDDESEESLAAMLEERLARLSQGGQR